MAKVHTIFLLISSSSIMFIANAQEFPTIFQDRPKKYAKFCVYLHDVVQGPAATVYEIARANISSTSPTFFGRQYVFDDLVTAEPDPNSKELGRAQGVVTFSDLTRPTLTMNFNMVFTDGKYNGSTLSFMGRNPLLETNRELPVVAGAGGFRRARGYSISNYYSYNPDTSDAVIEYMIYLEE